MLSWDKPIGPSTGNAGRFGRRWRLVGAGLSNVWRYGDLELAAPSGRLLLRGPNGTGKTTALEALWPYLLDLNAMRLAAGKARNTHLSSLMREAAEGRRRVGYVWLTFAGPSEDEPSKTTVISYGTRLSFSEGGTPPVRVVPFSVPGRPLHELVLWGPGRATLAPEQFTDSVSALGGTCFDDPDDYVRDLSTRVFASDPRDLVVLAERIRQVRNPALLGELSPRDAADALRASLPGVSEEVIEATGEALAESDATRRAFEADRAAADILEGFARVWAGHAADVVGAYHRRAAEAADGVKQAEREQRRLAGQHTQAAAEAEAAWRRHEELASEHEDTRRRLEAIERSQEYRDVGRLGELAAVVESQAATAEARWTTLEDAAFHAAQTSVADRDHLRNLADDLAGMVEDVAPLEPAVAGARPLAWAETPRPAYRVGERVADAGPHLRAEARTEILDEVVASLAGRAEELSHQADRARAFLAAHRSVADAEDAAKGVRNEAGRLAATAEEKAKLAKDRDTTARSAAADLADAIRAWLSGLDVEVGTRPTDLDVVEWSDPPVALAGAEHFAEATASWAHRTAAERRTQADAAAEAAGDLRREAAEKRAEAERIRTEDVLLPLPRPEWAGASDDTVAFGAAVDWQPGIEPTTQDIVEATIAAAGLLGATLTEEGAATAAWAVDATGPTLQENLGELLAPDPSHPLAAAAAAVLSRIGLAPTATTAGRAALVVGRDGTFRAGVLSAAVPEARDDQLRLPACHVGARRRREAALAHAAALDAEADRLDGQAGELDSRAVELRAAAAHALGVLSRFPNRDQLRDAEAARVAAVVAGREADERAAAAERVADEATQRAVEARRAWAAAVVHAGLPADPGQLDSLVNTAKQSAERLRRAARQVDTKFRTRLAAAADAVGRHDRSEILARYHAAAVDAHRQAEGARAEYDELAAQLERTAEAVLVRHAQVKARLDALGPELRAAEGASRGADTKVTELAVRVEGAGQRAAEAGPIAARAVAALRALLAVPGVVEATLQAEPAGEDTELLTQLRDALAGTPTAAKRTVRERADDARARLAGVWSLDPGADHPELDTYLVAHSAASFTPLGAAGHGRALAKKAEAALRAADEAALHDFVIGRLPAAVGQAWTRLFDWVAEVNAKMRSASASSGVGVAVRVSVRDDLPPLARTVYELTCKTGDALRDKVAKEEAGRALHQLINAADGDDMASRVRAAVDVREWVDVVYQVTRPGEPARNWNSRTGLSGGERRLVVLAPMLAAVAAAYDRFPPQAARLAALDEVPSEVDDEGREGLARYIAELDLDLIATSHHWDGAPGAWDGIDAHDLEAAPDGTVVAFPMLIRALAPLPGDEIHGMPAV